MDDETKSLLIAVVVKVAVDSMKGFGFSPKECAVAFRAGLFAMEEIARGSCSCGSGGSCARWRKASGSSPPRASNRGAAGEEKEMKLKVEVTQQDIEKGEPHFCSSCPISLALTRAFGEPMSIGYGEIWYGGVMDSQSSRVCRQGFSKEVKEFIARFDNGIAVEPFSFELEVSELPVAAGAHTREEGT